MSHATTGAAVARAPIGTNATIEQPFAAMAARRRPRSPNILYLDVALTAAQIGAYAGIEKTPDIDRLARSGVRFTAASAETDVGGPPVPELLLEHGYDGGVFGLGSYSDIDDRVESAVTFIGFRRPVPWAAYVRLDATKPYRVDAAVGRLVNALRRAGSYRRTMVTLVGAVHPGELYVPTVLSWPGQIPPRQRHDGAVRTGGWVPTLLETASCGATSGHVVEGVDLTAHLFDGVPVPERCSSLERVA